MGILECGVHKFQIGTDNTERSYYALTDESVTFNTTPDELEWIMKREKGK